MGLRSRTHRKPESGQEPGGDGQRFGRPGLWSSSRSELGWTGLDSRSTWYCSSAISIHGLSGPAWSVGWPAVGKQGHTPVFGGGVQTVGRPGSSASADTWKPLVDLRLAGMLGFLMEQGRKVRLGGGHGLAGFSDLWGTGARIWTGFYPTGNGEPLQVFEQGSDINKFLSR